MAEPPPWEQAGHCQACGAPNECRLESGEGYKGRCWCEEPTVPAGVVARLSEEWLEPRCLCPRCLHRLAADPTLALADLRPAPGGGA